MEAVFPSDEAALLRQYDRMLWKLVNRIHKRSSVRKWWDRDDLYSEAAIAFLDAIRKFDPDRTYQDAEGNTHKIKFISYAYGHVWDQLRNVTLRTGGFIRLPAHHAYDERHRDNFWRRVNGTKQFSLNDKGENYFEANIEQPDQEPTPTYPPELLADLAQALTSLPRRCRLVLEYRFGLGDKPMLTLEEVSRMLDLTKERIRQLEDEALAKVYLHLRRALGPRLAILAG